MNNKRHVRVGNPLKITGRLNWKRLRKVKFKRLALNFGIGTIVLTALMFAWFSKDLPTPSRIAKKINVPSTQILDRNGELLFAVSGDKKRLVIPLSEMPDSVKQATIALEDHNFYKHYGVDVKGVARSVFKNATSSSRVGGSTITQQFVKNALLTSNKTISRKIKELILALEMEALYSKDKILELYLNEIPYGSTSYGIESASRTYLGKPAKDLSLAEAATLAALPQAPSFYSPYGPNKDALMKRKNYALDQMAKYGYITQEKADEAKKQEIVFQERKDSIIAPHFVFYIQQLIADKYGEEALQNDGLKIVTTLDLKVQKQAEEAVEEGAKRLDRYGANNAALVAVDPKTGQVLAMVGSRDYFNQDIKGQVNVTTANRQPGSSFKPIVYAASFKEKYNPAYPLFDLTTDFGGGYKPNNYDGNTHGPISIRKALSNSLNIPAVKILSLVGVDNAIDFSRSLGITTLKDPSRYGLALVLGGGEVKPVEMAGAFSAFGNEGKFNQTTPILKVEDKQGHILEEYKDPPNKAVVDPQVAYLISDILSDTEARKMVFGFTNALTIPGHRVAVKTGTTQENRDAWTVGYTPQISTAVWVGNTDNTPMKKGADGSIVAAPLWNAFMSKYLKDKPNADFVRPDGIVQTTVDFLSNKLPTENTPDDQKVTDIFASWNKPTEKDDIHIKIRINKTNGKKANDNTPSELVEEKYCANVRSERPDAPNWEGPVRAWAEKAGLICQAPTDEDDSYSNIDQRPVSSITSPTNGSTVSANFDIVSQAVAHYGIRLHKVTLDGAEIASSTDSTIRKTVDINSIAVGNHTVTSEVTDNNGIVGKSESVTFTKSATPAGGTPDSSDSVPPIISNTSVDSSSTTAVFTWTTNEAADGLIEYGTSPSLGTSSTRDTAYTIAHSFTLNGLSSNTRYYFRILSRDQSGNVGFSTILTFQTKNK